MRPLAQTPAFVHVLQQHISMCECVCARVYVCVCVCFVFVFMFAFVPVPSTQCTVLIPAVRFPSAQKLIPPLQFKINSRVYHTYIDTRPPARPPARTRSKSKRSARAAPAGSSSCPERAAAAAAATPAPAPVPVPDAGAGACAAGAAGSPARSLFGLRSFPPLQSRTTSLRVRRTALDTNTKHGVFDEKQNKTKG